MSNRNEARTRKELIDPKLKNAGWFEFDWQCEPEYTISAGRVQFNGMNAKRGTKKKADYILRYAKSLIIAVVEAKDKSLNREEGRSQARDYAQRLGLWFAYSTNGYEIEFYDLKSNTQKTIERFHTPEELWNLYESYAGIKSNETKQQALLQDYYDETTTGQRRKPRYYQEKAVNLAINAIITGQNRVLITMATGTGKTFTSIQLVYKLWKSKFVKRILFIVDRNLLADQAYADFSNAMPKDACFRIKPNEDIRQSRDLYFGIYQSLVAGIDESSGEENRVDRFKEFPPDFFDLIIIDEAHRGARRNQECNDNSSWFKLLEYFESAIQVGLTATPKREESNDTYSHFGEPVVVYSLHDGIEDGYLAPYVIKRVTSNIDATGLTLTGEELDVTGRPVEARNYFTSDYERKLSLPQRTRAFAYNLLQHLFSTDPVGKTIVFCIDQNHAADMARYCRQAFEKYKLEYGITDYQGDYAVRITGADKDSNGKYPELEKFQNLDRDQPIIVTTSKLLTTGIDVKSVKNIVIFRNVTSVVEFKQIIGRGTRIYEPLSKAKEKLGFYIIEYANFSTRLFDDPNWDDNAQNIIEDQEIVINEDSSTEENQIENLEEENNTTGIFIETDPELRENIRYRMSEEFLSGRVSIVSESLSLIGPDGRPMSSRQYTLYQSQLFLKNVSNLKELNHLWRDINTREFFENETAPSLGVNIDHLTALFFENNRIRNIDKLDIIANLIFGKNIMTKEDRIARARELNPSVFNLKNENQLKFLHTALEVYKENDFKSFELSEEFWNLPKMKKFGGINSLKEIFGGLSPAKDYLVKLQNSLYDERIVY